MNQQYIKIGKEDLYLVVISNDNDSDLVIQLSELTNDGGQFIEKYINLEDAIKLSETLQNHIKKHEKTN